MAKTVVKPWGNSSAIRLPKNILQSMNLHNGEELDIHVLEGKMILEKKDREMTIEELFSGYSGEKFKTELQDLGEAVGKEKW